MASAEAFDNFDMNHLINPPTPKTASLGELAALFKDWVEFDDPIARTALILFIVFVVVPVILGTILILLGWHKPPKSSLRTGNTLSYFLPYPFSFWVLYTNPIGTLQSMKRRFGSTFKIPIPFEDVNLFLKPQSVRELVKLSVSSASTFHALYLMFPRFVHADTRKHIAAWRNLVRKDFLLRVEEYKSTMKKYTESHVNTWIPTGQENQWDAFEYATRCATELMLVSIGGQDFAETYGEAWTNKLLQLEGYTGSFMMQHIPDLPIGGAGFTSGFLKEIAKALEEEMCLRKSKSDDATVQDSVDDHISAYVKSELSQKLPVEAFASHVLCLMYLFVIEMKSTLGWLILDMIRNPQLGSDSRRVKEVLMSNFTKRAPPLVFRRTAGTKLEWMEETLNPFVLFAVSPALELSALDDPSDLCRDINEDQKDSSVVKPEELLFLQSYTPEMGIMLMIPLITDVFAPVFCEWVNTRAKAGEKLTVEDLDMDNIECTKLPWFGLRIPIRPIFVTSGVSFDSKKEQ